MVLSSWEHNVFARVKGMLMRRRTAMCPSGVAVGVADADRAEDQDSVVGVGEPRVGGFRS
jgi:hypothetical protein